MEDICRVDVLEAPQDLVEEVADVITTQALCFQQLVKVCLHKKLHDITWKESRKGKENAFLPSLLLPLRLKVEDEERNVTEHHG